MKKVAIVVQRCHESVVGGSESLAWHYATLLRNSYAVDVLTTTAVDISDWANSLPEGIETRDGINIHRFTVTLGRTPYWGRLLERLFRDFQSCAVGRYAGGTRYLPWSVPLQEEFIRTQGPYSEGLMKFIAEKWTEYKAILFITYLYPTTYFGLLQLPANRAFIVPTLHDEQTAYLSAYKHAARRARSLIWLTDAERRVGLDLWGDLPGRVVAMSVDTEPRLPARSESPYILYCGRIDPNKGCSELFQYFTEFKKAQPSNLRLLLTGEKHMAVPIHPDIHFLGFVPIEEKFRLMAGAKVFVMPSRNESFSIVTLEAMAQRTPVLASNKSEVLVDHMNLSGGGWIYHDYESFATVLHEMLSDEERCAELGNLAREYAVSRYRPEHIRESLMAAVDSGTEMVSKDEELTEAVSP